MAKTINTTPMSEAHRAAAREKIIEAERLEAEAARLRKGAAWNVKRAEYYEATNPGAAIHSGETD